MDLLRDSLPVRGEVTAVRTPLPAAGATDASAKHKGLPANGSFRAILRCARAIRRGGSI